MNFRQRLGQGLLGRKFVAVVAVGMQVTDRDRGHFLPLQNPDGCLQ